MTHPEYLEAFHEITMKVLPELSLALAKGEIEYGQRVTSALIARHDALWEKRRATAVMEAGNG